MSRYMREPFRSMEAYVPGEQPRDMVYIKLNTNESPFSPAPGVVAAMTDEAVKRLRLYSDPTGKVLKEKLAGLYGVQPENIFLSNGSDEILNFSFLAFAGKDGVRFPDITYGFYAVFADLYSIPYEQIPLEEDFSVDYRKYLGGDKLTVIANPNAPTGKTIPVSEIEKMLQANPDNVVIIDEAYVDFGGESCYPLIRKYDNLLVVRTYSKSRCMAGARLGYAIGPENLIADLEKIKFSTNPYNVNSMTLLLGAATVDEDVYYAAKCREIADIREWTTEQLRNLGFTVLDSKANFVFAAKPGVDGSWLYQQLKSRGILVRHFTSPRICDYNRITIGTRCQMEILIETIKDILGGIQ